MSELSEFSSWVAMLKLYAWTLPAGCFFAAALSLLGCHLAARDRAMQTVCVSQGAVFGVLLALALGRGLHHADPDSHLLPFVLSFAVSAATFLVTGIFTRKVGASKNTLFAASFGLLVALTHLVSALFPALESHTAQIFFGDLATLTEFDAKITFGLGLAATSLFFVFWRPMANQSFELASFGERITWQGARLGGLSLEGLLFEGLTLSILCYSVQFLGFLFTISLLFLPTTLLSFFTGGRLLRHFLACALLAVLSSAVGLLASLWFTRLPTVPSITLVAFVLGTGFVFVERLVFGRSGEKAPFTLPLPEEGMEADQRD